MIFPDLRPDESGAKEYTDLVTLIGSGTYGDVYRCQHKQTKTWYAIKRIKEAKESKMGLTGDKFMEILAFRELSHPNILSCKSIFFHGARLCFALELCNTSLKSILNSGHSLTAEDRRVAYHQILLGLDYLHSNHISHFDLKPDNILIKDNNGSSVFKITDFGLSLITGRFRGPSIVYTGPGFRWTPIYRPPEVFGSTLEVGQSSDMWSIGLTFFEMIIQTPIIQAEESRIPAKIADFLGRLPDDTDPGVADWHGPFINLCGKEYTPPTQPYMHTLFERHGVRPEERQFITKFLKYSPEARITAADALRDPFLANCNKSCNILDRDRYERNLPPLQRVMYGPLDEKIGSNDM